MEGTRKRGRPSKRWTDEVEVNLSIVRIRNSQGLIRDLRERRTVLLEATFCNGVQHLRRSWTRRKMKLIYAHTHFVQPRYKEEKNCNMIMHMELGEINIWTGGAAWGICNCIQKLRSLQLCRSASKIVRARYWSSYLGIRLYNICRLMVLSALQSEELRYCKYG